MIEPEVPAKKPKPRTKRVTAEEKRTREAIEAPLPEKDSESRMEALFAEPQPVIEAQARPAWGRLVSVATLALAVLGGAWIGHTLVDPEVIVANQQVRVVRPVCLSALDDAQALVTLSAQSIGLASDAIAATTADDLKALSTATDGLKTVTAQFVRAQNTYIDSSTRCREDFVPPSGPGGG